METQMNTQKYRCMVAHARTFVSLCRRIAALTPLAGVAILTMLVVSCGSKPTDPRTVIPADSLVYLELKDLGEALDAVASSPRFSEVAKSKPDTSAVKGIRISVAVTGFETSEDEVSAENSVLDFKPRFVAAAETNLWNYQAQRFADANLGEFVNDIYGGEVELNTSDKHGGKYFVWTARDGRKAYALVRGSVILFGNDESALEKCVTVMEGAAENIAGNARVKELPADSLAAGYVSPEGVAQLANIAGISLAMGAGEEGEVKSFIARVLPEIVRNSLLDATWFARRTDAGIEDNYVLKTNPEVKAVFAETFVPAGTAGAIPSAFVPGDVRSVSRYDLKDPRLSWRSLVLTAQKQTDAVSGNLIAAFSSSIFESFGVEDAETFLSGAASPLVTMISDGSDESDVLIARVTDAQILRKGIANEVNFAAAPEKRLGAEIWRSAGGEIAAAFLQDLVIIGDNDNVLKCLGAPTGENLGKRNNFKLMAESNAAASTLARDNEIASKVVEALSEKRSPDAVALSYSLTETRFNQNGIERRTVSDFGLIGALLGRMDPGN